MSKNVKKLLRLAIEAAIILIIFGVIYYYRAPLQQFLKPYLSRFLRNLNYQIEQTVPCQKPITFSLGAIDPKFKLSDNQILTAINEASAVWSQPINRQLFAYATTSGELAINFVYDYRQETTDKLKKLGIVVETNQQSYETLKAKYDALNAKYKLEAAALKQMSADFDRQQAAYNAEVAKWNKRGGATKEVVDRLDKTKNELELQLAAINAKTDSVNQLIENLNTEGDALNQLIKDLNLNVNKYNTTGDVVGREFEEGVYIQDENGRRIEVYEFGDRAQLVRLLAHELGHAIGLEHSTGTTDIMYYLNEAGNEKLTANDLMALQTRCRLK